MKLNRLGILEEIEALALLFDGCLIISVWVVKSVFWHSSHCIAAELWKIIFYWNEVDITAIWVCDPDCPWRFLILHNILMKRYTGRYKTNKLNSDLDFEI
jgi:hypothetical protein